MLLHVETKRHFGTKSAVFECKNFKGTKLKNGLLLRGNHLQVPLKTRYVHVYNNSFYLIYFKIILDKWFKNLINVVEILIFKNITFIFNSY